MFNFRRKNNSDPSVPKTEGQKLAQIKPSKTDQTSEKQDKKSLEKLLVDTVCFLLKSHNIRKSPAAVRESILETVDIFGPREAVIALQNNGCKASFGQLRPNNITNDILPLIAFRKNGEPTVIQNILPNGTLEIINLNARDKIEQILVSEFSNDFSSYVIIVQPFTSSERHADSGHWFFGAFGKSKWIYIQVMVAALVTNFLSMTTAIFTMVVYDRILPNNATESLIALSIGVIIALGFDFIIKALRSAFIDRASKRADLEISDRLFSRILKLSPTEQRQQVGAMSNTVREFETVREFFNSSTVVFFVDLPFVFLFIFVIWTVAGPLAYVPAVAVPVLIIVGLGIQPLLARVTRKSVDSSMSKNSVLVETLNGLETVTATGSGGIMKSRYKEAMLLQSTVGGKALKLSSFITNFAGSVQQYAQIATIIVGVFAIQQGNLTQGGLIAAMILGGRTMAPLGQLANTMAKANGALAAFRNLSKLFKQNADRKIASISRSELSGEIEFRNVTFQFDGASAPILSDVSFKIPSGQKVAIVGKMGSGKSTLSKLIAGIYQPSKGSILIDGIDVRQIDPADLRKNIGVMLQDSWLFSGTVRENIQMGYNEYSDDHILNIAKISGVDDFVSKHPNGYDMPVAERGTGLSGGQRQSINLARSILHDPNILLLDEPTSSLDQNSEKIVVKNLSEYCEQKTVVFVTHRTPILRIANRVLVIEGGKIIADDIPENLGISKG